MSENHLHGTGFRTYHFPVEGASQQLLEFSGKRTRKFLLAIDPDQKPQKQHLQSLQRLLEMPQVSVAGTEPEKRQAKMLESWSRISQSHLH